MKYLTLFLTIIFSFQYVFSQKNDVFSGELTYEIERVDKKDTNRTFMIIYAKDSLLKVVNFNSNSGKQQLIKHLRLNRSYILLETPKQNFAIRTNEHLVIDSIDNYTFMPGKRHKHKKHHKTYKVYKKVKSSPSSKSKSSRHKKRKKNTNFSLF